MSGRPENVEELDDFRRHREARLRAVKDEDGNPIEGDLLEFARAKTGVPYHGVLRYGDDAYDVLLNLDGRIVRVPMGDSGGIYDPRKHERLISNRTGVPVSIFLTGKRWRPIASALLASAEIEEGTGSTESQETRVWIGSYLDKFSPRPIRRHDPDDLFDALGYFEEEPLRDEDGQLYVPYLPLTVHLTRNVGLGGRVVAELPGRLTRLGFRRERLKVVRDGEERKRRTWRSPPGFDPDDEEEGSS